MKAATEGPRPLTFALLRMLGDGEFHSGEAMAADLGVSRAGVNNALREAEDFGLTLFRVQGRGYRLVDPPHWLDAAIVERDLGAHRGAFQVAILDSATSTNTLLLRQMAEGAPGGSVVAAEWQSGGRGRLGRAWHSGLGNALTFSVSWRFACGLAGLSGLSLAVGVAVIRALRGLGVNEARLKWPNDVVDAHGAKLGGVLIEAQGDMLGPSAVVIGIGLNVALPQPISAKIGQAATSLAEMQGRAPDRNRLLAALLVELGAILHGFAAHGFEAFRAEWESHHALQDRAVRLALPDGSQVAGIARGVTSEGALKLETQTGMRIFHAGEVSLRAEAEHAAD